MNNKHRGFTIVELLIVIVVIAILAAISIVSYTGIQSRANDSKMRSAVVQLEKSIMKWAVETNTTSIPGGLGSTTAVSATGCANGADGFFGSGSYLCTAENHLIAQGVLPVGYSDNLPRNKHYGSVGRTSIMLYRCSVPQYALFWTLENPTAEDTAGLNATLSACGYGSQIRDSWGMRAGKLIKLPS